MKQLSEGYIRDMKTVEFTDFVQLEEVVKYQDKDNKRDRPYTERTKERWISL